MSFKLAGTAADLPILLTKYEQQFSITLLPCYPDLSFHYVAPAMMANGQQAVLKCSVSDQGQKKEAIALEYFDGQGCVKLYDFDDQAGVILLEKADPGLILETVKDQEQATMFAVALMRVMHKSIDENNQFDTLHDWFDGLDHLRQRFHGETGPFPEYLINKAQTTSHDLLSTMKQTALLHGDLHYANILSSKEHGWIAIDPKGVIGEPEFEIPLPRLSNEMNLASIQRNIDCFVDISGHDRHRIISWLFAKAILAAWWSFEDNGEIWQPFIQYAEIVDLIK